jgi:membrane-associated protein
MFQFFNITALIETVGYAGLWFILFAESGLFIGFFLPGDSLLFTAGFLASQGVMNIWVVIILCFSAAVLGDNFGYTFGKKVGPKIFTKEDSLLFHKDNILKAQEFYEKYGNKTILLARFFPVIRTFAPILAGVGKMKYRDFFSYNIIGGFIWGVMLPLIGYWLGSTLPQADRYVLWIVGIIIFFSALPQITVILRNKERRGKIAEIFRSKSKPQS